jgi:AcrR family transcriptional regulator
MPDLGSPSRGHARRADAVRNARLLLAAARDLFEEHGPDVAMDEVARRAGVGNATLYRNFPTRGDLLAAVYADEVAALCQQGAALLAGPCAGEALFGWLGSFVVHVATKRALALAATVGSDGRRSELFGGWHESMMSTAGPLLARARQDGAVRPGLTVTDLLALASAAALAGATADHARQLLEMMRHGIASGHVATPTDSHRNGASAS